MTRTSYVAPPESIIEKNTHDAAQKIMELQKQLSADDQGRTNTLQHMIDLFMGDHSLGIPEDKRYVAFDAKTNKPADIIFRIKGMLSGKLKFRYVTPSTKADDVKRGDLIEAHVNAYYPTMKRRTQEDVAGQALFWQLLGGTSYIQQTVDMYYWDKNEQKRKAHEKIDDDDDSETQKKKDDEYNERVDEYRQWAGPPMVLEALDPRMVWPVRTKAKGIIAYVKFYRVTRYDFAESFRARGKAVHWDDDGKVSHIDTGVAGMEYAESADVGLSNSCEYYEYIDDHCVYYIADGHVVDKYEHRGGIKIFPAYCLQTGLNESATNSVGVLWPVRNEIMQLDFYRTLWANKAYLEIFPQLFAILDGNTDPLTGDDGKPVQWDVEPGTVKQLRGRLENPMANAASGTDFRALIEMESNEIDAATISGVARGIAGMQQPGYSINQLSQGMRTMWRDCITSRELQWAGIIEHYLWCIRHVIKEPSSVYAEAADDARDGRKVGTYATVSPSDIDDHFRIEATLDPDLPIDRQGLINIWWMLYKEGGATWDEFVREGKGQDSPIAQQKQIRREAMQKEAIGKIMEDAIALGRIRAQNKILEEGKFLELNPTFAIQNQLLKEARNPQPAADGGMAMPAPMGPPADGGTGIPPTGGMNPTDSAPGPRMGDMSSGNGLR